MSAPMANGKATALQPSLVATERMSSAIAARYGRRDYLTRRLLLIADCAGAAIALVLMFDLSPKARPIEYCALGFAAIPIWLVLFKIYGLYDRDIRRISHSTVDDLPWLLHAVLVGCLLLWVFYKVLPVEQLVFIDVFTFAFTSTATIIVLRWVARRLA